MHLPEPIDLDQNVVLNMKSNVVLPTKRTLVLVLQTQVESSNQVSEEDVGFHVGQVQANAHTRPFAERNQVLLGSLVAIVQPSFRHEGLGLREEDWIVVDQTLGC